MVKIMTVAYILSPEEGILRERCQTVGRQSN